MKKQLIMCGLGLCASLWGEPAAAAVSTFNAYIQTVEARLARQHRSSEAFLAPNAETQMRQGELIVERLTRSAGAEFSGVLLHHWRGTAFAPGARAADFESLMRDFNA